MLDREKYEEEQQRAREEQVRQIAEYLGEFIGLGAKVRQMPITTEPDEEILKEIEAIPIPEKGRDAREVGDELVHKVFERSLLTQHPRFFSFVASGVSPYSMAGSVLSDIYNINACGYETAPPISLIEEKLIRWMGSLAGFDENCGGVFTSGGSLSNLTGMMAARRLRLKEEDYPVGQAYLSDQTHSSVRKGLYLMGLRRDQVTTVPTDEAFKMRTDLLEEYIRADLAAGKKPFLVIGTLGTTNTGSIDPLEEIGRLAETYGLWFHVDGAYGGSVLFSDIYRNLAKGVEKADSLSWDTHKWAMQVYSCSCIIAKRKTDLVSVYAEHPEYLEDVIHADHTDSWDLGIEMSRPARAIKLWYTVQAMGTDKLSDVIDYSFFNGKTAKRALEKYPDWEITSPPMCGTVTFRYAPAGLSAEELDRLNGAISREMIREDFAYIVTTTIRNKRVLRMNMINCGTNDSDIIRTVDKLNEIAEKIFAEGKY